VIINAQKNKFPGDTIFITNQKETPYPGPTHYLPKNDMVINEKAELLTGDFVKGKNIL